MSAAPLLKPFVLLIPLHLLHLLLLVLPPLSDPLLSLALLQLPPLLLVPMSQLLQLLHLAFLQFVASAFFLFVFDVGLGAPAASNCFRNFRLASVPKSLVVIRRLHRRRCCCCAGPRETDPVLFALLHQQLPIAFAISNLLLPLVVSYLLLCCPASCDLLRLLWLSRTTHEHCCSIRYHRPKERADRCFVEAFGASLLVPWVSCSLLSKERVQPARLSGAL